MDIDHMNCTCGTNTPSGPGGACSSWCDTNQKAVCPGSPMGASRVPISSPVPFGTFSKPITVPMSGNPTITGANQNKTANGGKGTVIYDVSGSYFQAGLTNFSHQVLLDALASMPNQKGEIVLQFDPSVFKELVSKDLIEFYVDFHSPQHWISDPHYSPARLRASCCGTHAASSNALKETWIFDRKSSDHTGTIITREY